MKREIKFRAWDKLIKLVNELLEKDMRKNGH